MYEKQVHFTLHGSPKELILEITEYNDLIMMLTFHQVNIYLIEKICKLLLIYILIYIVVMVYFNS